MIIEIPGYKTLDLKYLVLDYNGTIAVDGTIPETVKERLKDLSKEFDIYVLTADTHGTAKQMCEGLPVKIMTFPSDAAMHEKLRIVKELSALGTYRYTVAAKEMPTTFSSRINTIFRECVTRYDYAQNIVVIHTIPGLAGAAASSVDAMAMSFVLGTIAGDDTVLIVMRDPNAAAAFCSEVKNLLS